MEKNSKVWFITGISRGFGKALAEEVLQSGNIVIGTTRNGKADIAAADGKLHVLPLDVSLPDKVKQALPAAHAIHGRLDVIVNNAGYGLLGAVEEASVAEAYMQFDTNVFGTLYVIQAALPFLRAQGSGHIVNISSIAGLAPMGGYGIYAASKFAVEGLSQSLLSEVKPLGIKVTVVEPGAFRTDFLADTSIHHTEKQIDDYDGSRGEVVRRLQSMAGKQIGDPVRGAKAIIDVVNSDDPPLHLILGSDALSRARQMLSELTAEIDRMEKVSLSTDYAETLATVS